MTAPARSAAMSQAVPEGAGPVAAPALGVVVWLRGMRDAGSNDQRPMDLVVLDVRKPEETHGDDAPDGAMAQARARLRQPPTDETLEQLLSALVPRKDYRQRFPIKVGTRVRFIPASQVDYFESEANYVRLHVAGRTFLIRESLTALAEQLDPAKYLRIHRSLLVNLSRVQEVESLYAGEYILYLTTGKQLTSGRTYRAAIQGAMGL